MVISNSCKDKGSLLKLPKVMEGQIIEYRKTFMKENTMAGQVHGWLDGYAGTYVCSRQIWKEAFNHYDGEPKKYTCRRKGAEVIPSRLHTQRTVQPLYILDVPYRDLKSLYLRSGSHLYRRRWRHSVLAGLLHHVSAFPHGQLRESFIRHFCRQYFCIRQIFGCLTVQDVPQLCYIAVTENHFVVLGNIEQSLCGL